MTEHRVFVTFVRALNAVFFLATSAYSLLAFIPFAYSVFLKPEVLWWIPDFLAIHVAVYWLTLLLTALTLKPYLYLPARPNAENVLDSLRIDRTTVGRWMASLYLAAGGVVGLLLVARPIMPTVGNDPRSFAIALIALAPPIWLAVFDHLAAQPESVELSDERHAFLTCVVAAACVWAVYAIGASFRLKHVVGIDLPLRGLVVAIGLSAVTHFFVFVGVFLALAATTRIARLTRRGGELEYGLLVVIGAAAAGYVIYQLILTPLTFVGFRAATAAAMVGLTLALVWSGVARWQGTARGTDRWTAQRLLLSPLGYRQSRVAPAVTLALLPWIAYGLVSATAQLDWNFIIQKLGVLLMWLVAMAAVNVLVRRARLMQGDLMLGVVSVAALGLFHGADMVTAQARVARHTQQGLLNPDSVFDRYAALDASFRLIRDQRFLQTHETADFYARLKANTLVAPALVTPPEIRFAPQLVRPKAKPPHIFLFVIDSLRRDYVSPYNPAAGFTPESARFASDSFVFRRAFTRYSGTGLAVPSIWAGGMLIHMIVQRPFDGRDALLTLLDGVGYRPVMGIDSVMRDLIPERPDIVELDRGVPSMMCDFCRTLRELQDKLTASAGDPRPVFSYTLPQNVHIAVASRHRVPAGVTYQGFFGPVADTVREIDRCFGDFIDFLRRTGRYDDSVVILTADHGDSLGEEGRWGHSYFMVPEVMRVPLIVHLPASLRSRVKADLSRVAFTTDLAPTLYALTGNAAADLGSLFGRPLFVDRGTDLQPRRHESFLLASSYGAVYGMLRHNGRKLYAADAIDGRDDAYDMSDDRQVRRVAITQAMLSLNRRLISEQLDELAASNHYTPGSSGVR